MSKPYHSALDTEGLSWCKIHLAQDGTAKRSSQALLRDSRQNILFFQDTILRAKHAHFKREQSNIKEVLVQTEIESIREIIVSYSLELFSVCLCI